MKAHPKLHDEEWLRVEYLDKQRPLVDIGNDIGVNKSAVGRALKRYSIPSRRRSSRFPKLNDKVWIKRMYEEELLSPNQIADLAEAPHASVVSSLRAIGVQMRSYKEGLATRFPNGRYGENHPRWKGGLPECLDCGDVTARRDAKRCKSCEGNNRFGENNFNWRGGKSPLNQLIRSSKEFKAWKKAVLERDKYTCRFCGISGVEIHADHIKPFAIYEDLRFDINNGRTLCRDCHMMTDTWGGSKDS